jgi:hypothetical protein
MKDGLGARIYDVQKCGLYKSRTSGSWGPPLANIIPHLLYYLGNNPRPVIWRRGGGPELVWTYWATETPLAPSCTVQPIQWWWLQIHCECVNLFWCSVPNIRRKSNSKKGQSIHYLIVTDCLWVLSRQKARYSPWVQTPVHTPRELNACIEQAITRVKAFITLSSYSSYSFNQRHEFRQTSYHYPGYTPTNIMKFMIAVYVSLPLP